MDSGSAGGGHGAVGWHARPHRLPARGAPDGIALIGVMDDATLSRFAELIVGFAANVQPGQIVAIGSEPGKELMVRAVAAGAYRAGAKFVDVVAVRPVRQARADPARARGHARLRAAVARRARARARRAPRRAGRADRPVGAGAARATSTPCAPAATSCRSCARAARSSTRARRTGRAPCPTPAWAALVFPDLEPDDALDAPVGADPAHVPPRRARSRRGVARARRTCSSASRERLTERRFDALHFEGPGTDLASACCRPRAGSRRASRRSTASCTCPTSRPRRSSRRPTPRASTATCARRSRSCVGGTIVRGLRVRFEGGRAVSIEADEGGEMLRTFAERDEGASRLGEVALVDGEGRIGPLDTVFYDTLIDENAASHIALGSAYEFTLGEEDRRAHQPLADPHRLHDRLAEVDVTGLDRRRRARAGAARRRLADLSPATLSARPGEVPERLNGHDWKSCAGVYSPPRVRIPPSPLALQSGGLLARAARM